jgi:hypothetical protein
VVSFLIVTIIYFALTLDMICPKTNCKNNIFFYTDLLSETKLPSTKLGRGPPMNSKLLKLVLIFEVKIYLKHVIGPP